MALFNYALLLIINLQNIICKPIKSYLLNVSPCVLLADLCLLSSSTSVSVRVVVYFCVCLVFFQSQQPLEDLDAQLRRALSPETVPVSTHTQVNTHTHTHLDIVL